MRQWIATLLVLVLALGAAPIALAEGAEPATLTVWLNHTWYPTDKFEGIIPDVIKEKTGVTLEPTRAVDESQLGLMIASGEMPDLIFTDRELSRLSSADLCYSYSELIEKYCPEWTPSKTAIVNASSYSTDGDYYFLFSHGFTTEEWQKAAGGVPSTGSLVYRADIAQKLGFDATQFTKMEELDALYAAVHAAYPELEVLTYGSVTGLGYFLSQYGMTTLTDWVEAADGTFQHMIDSANYEQMMRKLNGYYRLGYINPDSFAYDEATSDGMMYTGKSFSYLNATQGYANTMTSMGRKALKDEALNVLEMNPLGDMASYRLTNLGWCGTFITKNCENPEAAIRLMQYLFSDEGAKLTMWGREGFEYTPDENGNPVYSDEWIEATKDEETFASKYNTNFYFGTTALNEAIGRTCFLDQAYQDTYARIRARIVCEPWFGLAEPKDPDSDEYVIAKKLQDMMKTWNTTLVLSATEADFDANLKQLRENAKQVGVEQLTEYMNKEIAAKKALYQ